MHIGCSLTRIDAFDKVTGKAQYTDDLCPRNALVARVLHASIANGTVLGFDLAEALQVDGVVKIITCFDVPDRPFDTGTHPWSNDPALQGIEDRHLLNRRVRYYGDDIAAVVATDEISAHKALSLIRVRYEESPPVLDVFSAMEPGAAPVHARFPDNILAHTTEERGNYKAVISEPNLTVVDKWYRTGQVKHCQLESTSTFAYQENGHLVIYSATQTPHSLRRVIGQALGIPWGSVRIIKPCVGGGFGNKEDALYEPLAAFLCTQVAGRCVHLRLRREEDFQNTRVRHQLLFHLVSHIRPDGSIAARKMTAYANKGAYCHHGHAIASKGASAFKMMYRADATVTDLYTVLTNTPCAGAMRGYGAPQVAFAMEAHTDDICSAIGMDPVEFRHRNHMEVGYKEPSECLENYFDSLNQCLRKGCQLTNYHKKRTDFSFQRGSVRRGIGVASFWYNTGVWPFLLEACTCRMVLNQDGSVQLQMPEVEIGQGADTVFTQTAAQVLQLPLTAIHIVSAQDTDSVGLGSGAYASRQTYIGTAAIYNTGQLLIERILAHAAQMSKKAVETLRYQNGFVCNRQGNALYSIRDIALHSYYDLQQAHVICAEKTTQLKTNALSLGCCFAEVEVDIATGQVTVVDILNVHDCGRVVNPVLAQVQVYGGISMGLGWALAEQMQFDKKTGRLHQDNLLDYKLPTAMDHPPKIRASFIENPEPTNPFGVKALGEPPVVPVAPAIRNAILHATGVAFDSLPMTGQACLTKFRKEGLL